MCAINHLVANKNSACLPWVCQWRLHFPSVRLVGVANRACISLGPWLGRARPPPPAPLPGPLWTPAPLRRAPCTHFHARPRSPARAQGLGEAGAAPDSQPPGGTAGQTPAAPVLRAAARVPARGAPRRSRPPRQPRARPDLCPLLGPLSWRPPQSLDKQRPGAILGRGTVPGRVVGAVRAPPRTLAVCRGPPGHPLLAFRVSGDALPAPVGHSEMQKSGRGALRGWQPRSPKSGRHLLSPPPTYFCLPGGSQGQKEC